MPDQPAPFLCAYCGAILGEKYREHNSRLTHLRVYRHARIAGSGVDQSGADEHALYAICKVPDGSVYCERCGRETTWYASGAALEEMLSRHKSRAFGLLLAK